MDDDVNASTHSSDDEFEPTIILAKALSLKDAGNTLLKEARYADAIESYEKGIKQLKKVLAEDQKSDYEDAFKALHANLALANLKAERYHEGMIAASEVLKFDTHNVRALYRRGVCHSRLANFDRARSDFQAVLALDGENAEAKNELNLLRSKERQFKQKEKALYRNVFDTPGLYSDREQELERKREEECLKTEALRKQYEADNPPGSERPTFEKWKADQDELTRKREEKERKEREERDRLQRQERQKNQSTTCELDEEDKKILEETAARGYCYFRKSQLTSAEQELKKANVPQKIDTDSPLAQTTSPDSNSNKKGMSNWNAQGTTYEEKDTTKWCLEKFTSILENSKYESPGCSTDMNDPSNFSTILQAAMVAGKEQQNFAAIERLIPFKIRITKAKMKSDCQMMVVRASVRRMYEFSDLILTFEHITMDLQSRQQVQQTNSYSAHLNEVASAREEGVALEDLIRGQLRISNQPHADKDTLQALSIEIAKRRMCLIISF